jgi:hypothetical protein
MNYIFFTGMFFIALFLILNYYKRKKVVRLKRMLKKKWGVPKENEYYNFELVNRYFKMVTKNNTDVHQYIDDKTANDLDLNEVFKFMDRTSSKIGQQYLYAKLRTLTANTDKLKKFDELVEQFSINEILRTNCQLELLKLNENSSYYLEELLHKEQMKVPKWFKLVYVLSFTMLLCIILAYVYPVVVLLLIPLFIVNMGIHYLNKRHINHYLIAVSEFLKSITISKNISKHKTIEDHIGEASFLKKDYKT